MNVAIQREATVYDEPEVIARSAQELVGDLNPQQAEAVQYRGQEPVQAPAKPAC